MSQADGRAIYEVRCAEQVLRTLERLQLQATRAGIGEMMLDALRTLYHRLNTKPEAFGEPLHELRAFQLEVRVGGVPPLLVRYAVDRLRRLVYITGVHVTSWPRSQM